MNRWDWVFVVGPFVVMAAVALLAVRRARRAL